MPVATADLADLIKRLRLAGFRIDTRQYLTAHELLYTYARSGKPLLDDPPALASHLGPVFCTQAAEQDRFAAEVAAWRGMRAPPSETARKDEVPFSVWRRWRRTGALAVLGVALSIVVGFLLVYEYREVTLDGRVVVGHPGTASPRDARVRFRDQTVKPAADGTFKVSTRRAFGFDALTGELDGYAPDSKSVQADSEHPVVLTLRPLPAGQEPPKQEPTRLRIESARAISLGAPPPAERVGGVPWKEIAGWSTLTAAIAFSLLAGMAALRRYLARGRLEAFAELQRQLALRRLEHAGDVDEIALTPPPASAVDVDDFALRRVASSWRRPREQAVFELDTVATIDTTLRAGGLFAPVYAPRRTSPEYLALVHRRSDDDHWARFVMEWLNTFAANGVAVDVLTFHDDPRTCYDTGKRRRAYPLATLLAQHHRATVLVFAETRVCFTATDTFEPWLQSLWALPRRALFTPEVPYRWGYREWKLAAEGFVVLPANVDGFRRFGEVSSDWRIDRLYPTSYARAFPRLLADDPESWLGRHVPQAEAIDRLVGQLRGYLGPRPFEWLCACAVYPQIAWSLTLYLARGREGGLEALPALGRLPWLRYGFMPDWLRRTLIAQMSKEEDQKVRRAVESLLEEIALSARPADTGKPYASTDRGALSIARWIGPADLLGAAPPGSPLSDRVFLGFMSGSNVDPLSMSVKDSLLALFRRGASAFDNAAASPADTPPVREERPFRIYLSYGHSDGTPYEGRLSDRLRVKWPDAEIFSAHRTSTSGVTSLGDIEGAVRRADVVLAMISPKWRDRPTITGLTLKGEPAQSEVAAALAQDKRVVPVLVGGARMPRESELPPELTRLRRIQAIDLSDKHWDAGVERLIEILARERGEPASVASKQTAGKLSPTPLRARAMDAASAGRQAARAGLARLRDLAAYHPFTGAALASAVVGLVAAAILWRSLPQQLVPVASDTGLSFAVFSPDGRWLAVRDASGQAVLVDAAKDAATFPLRVPGSEATAVAFATDGTAVGVGYKNGMVRRFEVPNGGEIPLDAERRSNITTILALATGQDGYYALLAPNGLVVGSLPEKQSVDLGSRATPPISGAVGGSFDAGARSVAVAFKNGAVRVFNFDRASIRGLDTAFDCAPAPMPVLSPDGQRLACTDTDGSVLLWNVNAIRPPVPPRRLQNRDRSVVSLAFSPDSLTLAVAYGTHDIEFWDVPDARFLASTRVAGKSPPRAIAFSPLGDRFAAAGLVDVEFLSMGMSDSGSTGGNIPPTNDPVVQAGTDLVPSLLRMTVNAARSSLDRHQFVVGTVKTQSSSATKDTIVAQSPIRGTRAAAGTAVDVTVSDGSLVRVPNVVGMPPDAAERTLAAAGLKASMFGVAKGPIEAQNPSAGIEVPRNSEVRMVSGGNEVQQVAPQLNRPPDGLPAATPNAPNVTPFPNQQRAQ